MTRESASLARAIEAVRGLLAETSRSEVLARYRIGGVIAEVLTQPSTYGESPVERIADALDVHASTLYAAAAVTKKWSLEETVRMTKEVSSRGLPLSWSHLLELIRVRTAARRAQLAKEALAESWSVRELRAAIGASRELPSTSVATLDVMASIQVALSEGTRTAKRASADVAAFMGALETRLVSEGTDERLMRKTLDAFDELDRRIQAARSLLRSGGSWAPGSSPSASPGRVDAERVARARHCS